MELNKQHRDVIRELNAFFEEPLSEYKEKRIAMIFDKYASEKVVIKEKVVEKVVKEYIYVNAPLKPELKAIFDPIAIRDEVCKVIGITRREFYFKSKEERYVFPRQVFFWLCRRHTMLSYKRISSFARCEDHTTVMHDIAEIWDVIETNPEKAAQIETIERNLIQKAKGVYCNIEIPYGKIA